MFQHSVTSPIVVLIQALNFILSIKTCLSTAILQRPNDVNNHLLGPDLTVGLFTSQPCYIICVYTIFGTEVVLFLSFMFDPSLLVSLNVLVMLGRRGIKNNKSILNVQIHNVSAQGSVSKPETHSALNSFVSVLLCEGAQRGFVLFLPKHISKKGDGTAHVPRCPHPTIQRYSCLASLQLMRVDPFVCAFITKAHSF